MEPSGRDKIKMRDTCSRLRAVSVMRVLGFGPVSWFVGCSSESGRGPFCMNYGLCPFLFNNKKILDGKKKILI